jgi:hypothetical protein
MPEGKARAARFGKPFTRLARNRLRTFRDQTSCGRVYFVHVSCMEAAHMRKRNKRPCCHKIVLKLPDLDHAKSAVLNNLSSPHSRRNCKFAMEQFITWYCSEPRLALNRTVVLRFRLFLESQGLAAGTVNQRLAAVRRLTYEAADSGLLGPEFGERRGRPNFPRSEPPWDAVGQGDLRECHLVRRSKVR